MKLFTARYTLRNGHQATLTVIAASSCAAVQQLLDHFGLRLASCKVGPLS